LVFETLTTLVFRFVLCLRDVLVTASGHFLVDYANMTSFTEPKCLKRIATPPEEDQAKAIGDVHENSVKFGNVVPEMCVQTDRQTDRQKCIQTHARRITWSYRRTRTKRYKLMLYDWEGKRRSGVALAMRHRLN